MSGGILLLNNRKRITPAHRQWKNRYPSKATSVGLVWECAKKGLRSGMVLFGSWQQVGTLYECSVISVVS